MKKRFFAIVIGFLTLIILCGCKTEVEDRDYTLEFNEKTYEGKYTGTFENNKPVESGKFVCGEKGDDKYFIYDGSWEDGEMKGDGILSTNNYIVHFPKTDTYEAVDRTGIFEGNVVDGIANGKGSFAAKNDEGDSYTYEGDWKDGLWNGEGKQTFEDKEYYVRIGHFVDGDFAPTESDFFITLGTLEDSCQYTLSDETIKFIDDNAKIFTKHKGDEIENNTSDDFSINEYKKNPLKQKPGFTDINNLEIIQAEEYELFNRDYTFVLAAESGFENIYYLHYLGTSKKMVQGNTISVKILPLGYSTYSNVSGGKSWAIVGAVVKVK